MPQRPLKPCSLPGCPALVRGGGRCARHAQEQKARSDAGRPTKRARGYPSRPEWEALKRRILRRDPVCRLCGLAASQTADHIVSLKDGGTNDEANLQGVCLSCNSRKAGRFEGAFGNARRPAP